MDQSKVSAIQDNILQAMKTYYDEEARNMKYDITVEAEVVDVSKKKDGVYTVKSDGARFMAYAMPGASYYTSDMVLVSVPNGDYNNQKFILGKKADDEVSSTYQLKMPFDDFIGLDRFEGYAQTMPKSYWANKPEQYDGEYFIGKYHSDEGTMIGCTKLGISADFTTLLSQYQPSRGIYGLRILISGISKTTNITESTKASKELYFTNLDMYGNTYAFQVPYTQQKVFDVSEFLRIQDMEIYFYQDFNFADSVNKMIPYNDVPPNIRIENLEVRMGMTADEFNEEKVILYTFDPLTYSTLNGDKSLKFPRTMHVSWVHKEKTGEFSVVDEGEELAHQQETTKMDTHIYWYRFNYGTVIEDNTSPEKYGGINWEHLSEFDDKFEVTYDIAATGSREKFKVVVQHDGVHHVSQQLIFSNVNDVGEDIDKDELILKCFRVENNTLVDDNAINSFYVYDENNRVLKDDNNQSFSDIIYYLQIHQRNAELSQYVPLTADGNMTVTWKFPQGHTMFNSFEEITVDDPGFTGYAETDPEFINLKKITLKFKIKSVYQVRYIDNTIGALVVRDNQDGQTSEKFVKRDFLFGNAGSFGHEYTPMIYFASPAAGANLVVKQKYFNLECQIYNRFGEQVNLENITYDWRVIGGAVVTDDIAGSNQITIGAGKSFSGVVQNDIPPVFEVTITGAADYPITARQGVLFSNGLQYLLDHDIITPTRVEFKSDGSSPIYYSNEFSVIDMIDGVYEYPTWTINTNMLFALQEHNYAASEFTQSNDNRVIHPAYKTYSLTQFDKKANIQWNNIYADNTSYQVYLTYTSSLDESLKTEWYPDTTDNYLIVAQSIAFARNHYPSSLINEWDNNELVIDQENNALLAKMIAAGTKDRDNRFTGVAMGEWRDKADSSLEQVGLYGFNNGEQSFALRQDGTGFIGPSGKGRIEFDGTQALISNADKSCYINLNPVKITSETTVADLYKTNNKSFSQYFLYAKTPKTKDITDNLLPEDTSYWTQQFINDNANDYFIVDPNNGVLTSGGIIAKYGRLGNWYIGKEGLYQKATVDLGEGEETKFMYLGFDGVSEEDYQAKKDEITAEYERLLAEAELRKNQVLFEYDPIHYRNMGTGFYDVYTLLHGLLLSADENLIDDSEFGTYAGNYISNNGNEAFNHKDPGHYHYNLDGSIKGTYMVHPYTTARYFMRKAASGYIYTITTDTFALKTFYTTSLQDAIDRYGTLTRWNGQYNRTSILEARNNAFAAYQGYENDYNLQIEEIANAPSIYEEEVRQIEAWYQEQLASIKDLVEEKTRYCVFAGNLEWRDPVFSVDWEGNMAARSGIIGKYHPWYIDDYALTQKNNFGRIYLGNPAWNPNNPATDDTKYSVLLQRKSENSNEIWMDNTSEDGVSRAVGFAISAGSDAQYDNADKTKLGMKFGVRMDGFLYSTMGLIGGWTINEVQLVSAQAGIVMNAQNSYIVVGKGPDDNHENYSIILDGKRGIIAVKNQGTDTSTGQIQLAGYNFEARTAGTVTYTHTLAGSEQTKTYSNIGGSDGWSNSTDWGTGGSFSISGTVNVPDGSKLTSSGVSNITLNTTNSIGIIDRNESGDQQGYGLGIVTGTTSDGKKSVVLYPVGATANYSSLGTSTALWNIYANIISCAGLDTAGYISARTFYMNNEKVATEPYVYNLLVDVWNAIHSASAGVGNNGSAITSLGNKLYGEVIVDGRYQVEHIGNYAFKVNVILTKKNGTEVDTGSGNFSSISHVHAVNLSLSGTTLSSISQGHQTAVGTGTTVDINHTHSGSASFNEDGTVSITIDGANFSSTTTTFKSGSVTATSWYKARAYARMSLESDGSNSKVIAWNLSGTELGTISVGSIYNKGYSAGYSDGYGDGEDAASCDRAHAGATRTQNGVKQVLKWVEA